RMSALMELPVKFVFTHDAFRVGEDGPTHEPIKQEAQMRLMEQMDNLSGKQSVLVIRPADSAETVAAWKMAMENTDSPTVLIFSRQNLEDLPAQKGDRREEAKGAERGGYVVYENPAATATLVGNGSEVANLIHAAKELEKDGINVRVVSVPSVGLFMRQDADYRHSVIPRGSEVFGLTAGLPTTLYPLMKEASRWDVKGLERFGASAPYKVLEEKFGFTLPHVIEAVRTFATGK
ncbi:MAG: transketolase, partial [Paramuribaculum sp.]|nr:transketolase [Paramuribaculum sp.]